ncbi:DUF3224 domain-containing protein [Colwellia sp. MEBiC06753]
MKATGTFEVNVTPQHDTNCPAGRMLLNKVYSGDITGTGSGQMISKRMENGHAVYFAIEEVTATIAGHSGSFTLLHSGKMTPQGQTLSIEIMPNSGTKALSTISGSCDIQQENGVHHYHFDYQL